MGKREKRPSRSRQEKITLGNLSKHIPLSSEILPGSMSTRDILGYNVINGPQINNYRNEEQSVGKTQSAPFLPPQRDISFFTGREEEMKRLEALLLAPDCPRTVAISGVTGTGGMGKSALASHFARLHRDRFPDGVFGLRVHGKQITTIAAEFAKLAGVTIDKAELSAAQIMQQAFQDKRALLIFDNITEAAAQELRPFDSPCSIIITTRDGSLLRSFDIPVEAHIKLLRFTPQESYEMLQKLLGEGDHRVRAEMKAAQKLHELVGGLPLALRIIGGILQEQPFTSLASFVEMLSDEKKRLSYLHDPIDPNELDVRVSFEFSLKFLTEDQKDLFASLGACAQEGFHLRTAQVVSEQTESLLNKNLGRLFSLSLLEKGKEQGWFVLHPLLFLFSRELAESRNDLLSLAEKRHTAFFFSYALQHQKDMDLLEIELNDLLLTATRLVSDLKAANDFFRAFRNFFETRGYWQEALEMIERFLKVAEARRDYYRMSHFLLQKGLFLQLQVKLEEARSTFEDARSAALRITHYDERQRLLARVLNSLGSVLQRQEKYDQALQVFQQSLRIEQERNDKQGQGVVWNSIGEVYQRQGNLELASDAFQRSFELGHDREKHRAQVLNSHGNALLQQNQIKEAKEKFEESLALRIRARDKRGEAISLSSLGKIYQQENRFELALDYYQRSLKIEREIGNLQGQAKVLHLVAGVYQRRNELEQALATCQQAYELLVRLKDLPGQAKVLNTMGGICLRQGNLEQARDYFQQSYDARGEEDDIGRAVALQSMAKALQKLNRQKEALEKIEACFVIYERLHNKRELYSTTEVLVALCKKLNMKAEAASYVRRALIICKDDHRLVNFLRQLS